MACTVQRDRNGAIEKVLAPNGKESILFQALDNRLGDKEAALEAYSFVFTDNFKTAFGDWLNPDESLSDKLDENGEPLDVHAIAPPIKVSLGTTIPGYSEQDMKDVSDLLINKYISNFRELTERGVTVKTGQLVNSIKNSLLREAFSKTNGEKLPIQGVEGREVLNVLKEYLDNLEVVEGELVETAAAKRLLKINNIQARSPISSEFPSQNNHDNFLDIYEQWNDVIEGEQQNLTRAGFQSAMANRMKNYGLKMSLGQATLEETEEGSSYERIYSRSRVSEDMKSKVNEKIKTFLATIESNDVSYLGYKRFIPFETVYADMQNGLAGSENFAEMLVRLNKMSKTKPHVKQVVDKLMQEDENMMSAFFFTFALHKNDFLLFKETNTGLVIMDAKRNSMENRYMSVWRANSVQKEGATNLRHLYKLVETEESVFEGTGPKYTINKPAANNIVSNWNKMQEIYDVDPKAPIPTAQITAMVNFLRGFGVDVSGKSAEQDVIALQAYLETGDNTFSEGAAPLRGMSLYKSMISSENHQLVRIVNAIVDGSASRNKFNEFTAKENPQNVYSSHAGILKKFASIALSQETDIFGSFINSAGNSIFPINLTTVMDDLMLDLKGRDAYFFEDFYQDGFFNPVDVKESASGKKYQSLYLQMFNGKTEKGNLTAFTKLARKNLRGVTLDAYKKLDGRSIEYKGLNKKNSMYLRMGGFLNPDGKKGFVMMSTPNLADRSKMKFYPIASVETMMEKLKMSEEDIIKGIIIQDLVRYKQAEEDLANLPENRLVPGFHTGKDGERGNAFKMQQFTVVENEQISDVPLFGNPSFRLSDVNWTAYAKGEMLDVNRSLVNNALNIEVQKVKDYINQKAQETKQEFIEAGLIKGKGIKNIKSSYANIDTLFRSYTLNTMIHKIELQKFSRGGISFNKNYTDFSKRFGNMETPGYKLLLKGMLAKEGPMADWGFFNEFNEGLMEDFFTTPEVYDEIGDSITLGLMEIDGLSVEEASKVGNAFKGGMSNKSDAFGVIPLVTYRALRQGRGEWSDVEERAYQRYTNAPSGQKKYMDDNGNRLRLEPIKQYYDRMTFMDGRMVPQATKNSYMVLIEEFTMTNPKADLIRKRMEGIDQFQGLDPMHVVNTVSTKKLAKIGVEDLSIDTEAKLVNMTVAKMQGSGFRIPQLIPDKGKKKSGILGRQFMINIIANLDLSNPAKNYNVDNAVNLNSEQIFDLYQESLATKIEKAYTSLMDELGYNALDKAVRENKGIQDAKLNFLQKLRDIFAQEATDKELPENYVQALTIEKNEKGDWQFMMPLSFPNFKRKFEGILMGVLKKRIIKQKVNGGSAKQIAELGGHITSQDAGITELKFVRYENGKIKKAEVAIRADIAAQFGFKPGDDLSQIPEELRTIIGYRIPNQSKNSDIPLIIKYVLPDNYDQAIVVPGGITTQQGSDFDIDTLYLLMPNTKLNKETQRPEKIKVPYSTLFDERGNLNKKELNSLSKLELENVIIDVAESILTSPVHFKEVVTPLDSPDLKNIEDFVKETLELQVEFDPNDPMTEVRLEEINKDGLAGVGLYANALSGTNIGRYSSMVINEGTPMIDGVPYNTLQNTYDNKSISENPLVENRENELIEYVISKRISSSVDNAKDPGMFYRNDNFFTGMVHTLFDSVGINEFDTHGYMNQPIIRLLSDVYKAGEFTPNKIFIAIEETWKEFVESKEEDNAYMEDVWIGSKNEALEFGPHEMSSDRLFNITDGETREQANYLANFLVFFKTGRELSKAYKVINQDKGADKASFGGLLEFRGLYESLLENKIVSGVEGILDGNEYPMQKAFNVSIEKMLAFGDQFFLHRMHSVRVAKEHIRTLLNIENLTEADHRNIEESMLLYMMSQNKEDNPLSSVFTEDNVSRLLLNSSTSLVSIVEDLKDTYPGLKDNAFISNLIEHPENLRPEVPLTRLRFQNLYSFSKFEKDMFSDGIKNMFANPSMYTQDPVGQNAIRNFALDLIRVSLLSHGFTPGHDTFIDIIPVAMLTKAANYFRNEKERVKIDNNYFGNDFAHKFIRNFYYTDIVPNVKVAKEKVSAAVTKGNFIRIDSKDSRIYSVVHGQPVAYFTVNTKDGKVLFVRESFDPRGEAIYAKSSTLGIPYGLKEMNMYDAEGKKLTKSVGETTGRFIRVKGSNTMPGIEHQQRKIRDTIARQDEQAQKIC